LTRIINLWNSQGGLSDGYKNFISGNELPDETYKEDGVALFRVQGSGPENMQAIQVEPVSLSSVWNKPFLFSGVNSGNLYFFRILMTSVNSK